MHELFECFFRFQVTLKMIHLSTDSYAIHKASDKLYKSFAKKSDKFAEVYIGTVYDHSGAHPFSHLKALSLSNISVLTKKMEIIRFCKDTIAKFKIIQKCMMQTHTRALDSKAKNTKGDRGASASVSNDPLPIPHQSQDLVNILDDMVEDINQFIYSVHLK